MKGFHVRSLFSGLSCGARIALIYIMVGALWIVLSNFGVAFLFGENRESQIAEVLKGLTFVTVSAALIYVLVGRAVSFIKKSEDALLESRTTLSTLMDNLPGVAYRCKGAECPFDFINSAVYELTGYPPSVMTEKHKLDALIIEEDREQVRTSLRSALDRRLPFKLMYRIRSADGNTKWVWEQGRGIYSEHGELIGMEGLVTDITERRRAEEALKRSEEIYRAIIEGTSDAILMVDRDRTIMSVNRAFLELFGYSWEELEGKSVRIIHPSQESFENFARAAYPALEEAPLRIEWELKKKDGTVFPIDGTYSAITGPDGSVVGHVGIIRDITDRRQSERELREYREHLEDMVSDRTRELQEAQKALVQREKLKTLGAIAAEVAHEIRNPLVSIGGFARRLQKKYPDAREAEIILRESQRLETMLNRLSEYLRPVEMRPQESPVNSILTDSIGLLAPELQKEMIKVHLDLHPDLPSAHVDPAILTQVFVAMIRNVIRMMNSERDLTVRTYYGEHRVYVDMVSPTKMKVKDPDLLLLPFDETEQGAGISLTFKLLKGMGGALSVSQEDDKAVFSVSLVKCQGALDHMDSDQEWTQTG